MVKATEQISQFITDFRFEDVPADSVARAKELMLDTVGVTLAGSVQPLGQMIRDYTQEVGSKPECAVIGGKFRTSAPDAALTNGTLSHAIDYDDMAWGAHSGPCLVPVVLALGEKLKFSGKQVLEAMLTGLETWGALMAGSDNTASSFFIHITAMYGCLAAAASASRMLGLDVDQTRSALGIATSQISGVRDNMGTMVKSFHAGLVARAGVTAAMLAKKGYEGERNVIESPRGWGASYMGVGRFDPEKMVKDLGKTFHTAQAINFKRYPCCWGQYRLIEATFHLMRENNISYKDIATITIDHAFNNAGPLLFSKPDTALRGKFSAQYTIAAAILDGKVDIDTYKDQRYPDPKLDEAMDKVKVVIHTDWPIERPGPPAPVTILRKDGRAFTHQATVLPGTPAMPFSKEEFYGKYEKCAGLSLSSEKVKSSLEMLQKFEDVADITELADIIIG